jgi:hypothetical protein
VETQSNIYVVFNGPNVNTNVLIYEINGFKSKNVIIDLNNVWKWLGFSQKAHAKTSIKKYFVLDKDYKNLLSQHREQTQESRGGHNKEMILLNAVGTTKHDHIYISMYLHKTHRTTGNCAGPYPYDKSPGYDAFATASLPPRLSFDRSCLQDVPDTSSFVQTPYRPCTIAHKHPSQTPPNTKTMNL